MSTRRMSIKKLKHLNFFKQVPQLNSIFLISTRWRAHEKIYELYTYEACFNFFLFGVKSRIMFVDEFHLKCFDNNFNFSLTSELVSAKTEARRIIEIFYRQRANFASTSFYGSLLLFLRLNIPFYCMSFFWWWKFPTQINLHLLFRSNSTSSLTWETWKLKCNKFSCSLRT